MEEKERENKNKAEVAGFVRQMINTKGWQEVIKPTLESIREGALAKFRSSSKYEDLIHAQQRYNVADYILESIEVTLAEGEQAIEELKTNEHPS